MNQKSVLFVCVHNSARSQMAEAFLKKLGGERFEVESAGLEPAPINPLAIEAMREVGIDISANRTQDVFELFKAGRKYDYVITVCDEASGQRCPLFPGKAERLHWSFPDPSAFARSHVEKLKLMRMLRDDIKKIVQEWLSNYE
jgi:arsenate reductase (thioredoxin)